MPTSPFRTPTHRLSCFCLVLPALLLNYFGQSALVLENGKEITRPFFRLAPRWALYPLVLLPTIAAVIASETVISGVFSLTRRAVLGNYFPRVGIHQTFEKALGQSSSVCRWRLVSARLGNSFSWL